MNNYYNKYLKYKLKYLNLKKSLNVMVGSGSKYGIFMLCMIKDHYVFGACITAYVHRQLINKTNKNIDLNIMCDDYIYKKYNKTLSKYFDKVINLTLIHYDLLNSYNFSKSKYTWMGYSLSKWECLKYEEYNKVLFLDIDILPINVNFYDIFDYNTPAFLNWNRNKLKNCINNTKYRPNFNGTYDNLIRDTRTIGSIDGGICLLEPSIKIHREYRNMSDTLFKNGIYSASHTGPDELSLYYFYLKQNIKLHDICKDYATIPWEDNINNVKGYNFLSWVKPWKKPLFLNWNEEMVWRAIYNRMPKYGKIKSLQKKVTSDYIDEYKSFSIKFKQKFNNIEDKYKKEFDDILNSKKLDYNKLIKLENKVTYDKRFGLLNIDLDEIIGST